jgi:two-component system, chemotaxis family, response regulator Rcp1
MGLMSADHIILAEDNPADIFLVKESFKQHGISCTLDVVNDGEDAMRVIDRFDGDVDAPRVAAIVLDLNLPKCGGDEIIRRLRRSEKLVSVPVVIMTSSEAPRDKALVNEIESGCYFRKSASLEEFLKLGGVVKAMMHRSRAASADV